MRKRGEYQRRGGGKKNLKETPAGPGSGGGGGGGGGGERADGGRATASALLLQPLSSTVPLSGGGAASRRASLRGTAPAGVYIEAARAGTLPAGGGEPLLPPLRGGGDCDDGRGAGGRALERASSGRGPAGRDAPKSLAGRPPPPAVGAPSLRREEHTESPSATEWGRPSARRRRRSTWTPQPAAHPVCCCCRRERRAGRAPEGRPERPWREPPTDHRGCAGWPPSLEWRRRRKRSLAKRRRPKAKEEEPFFSGPPPATGAPSSRCYISTLSPRSQKDAPNFHHGRVSISGDTGKTDHPLPHLMGRSPAQGAGGRGRRGIAGTSGSLQEGGCFLEGCLVQEKLTRFAKTPDSGHFLDPPGWEAPGKPGTQEINHQT
uniref:growth/differentiation factor 7-like n=1 Tax=Podarcis muralis TaxID=64176 RepID=UPI00109FC29C|nr:growth/differentiation factor 7-like [Podarcis muralis]